MHTLIVEDWITVSGPGGDTITQDEMRWVDLEPFQDAVFYVECREATGSTKATIALQTAPAKDETLFQQVASTVFAASGTPTLLPVLLASATTPIARYCRWQIQGPAVAWDATFRILVAANSPGM
jgi:hypothetical protein